MPPYTVEASYQYSPLPEGNIRLLQLLPDSNINAPVHGVIFDYPLLNFIRSAHHLYEALSYAWGSLQKTRFISINNRNLPVTTNLYSALQHLRDPLLKRTLWIDAVCINQNDLDERRLQVQSMVTIYTMASHVIVWLGEVETDGERALEEIHRAAYLNKQPTETDPTVQNGVLKLLQRPWFKRIWVLQEVAAARNILIMYNSMEIDGYTFCLGVNSLGNIYEGKPDLNTIIPTALYLIGRTAYRPEKAPGELRKFSLNISTLAELLDTYHAREASDRHDKIYALLGMSSDGYSSGGFSPDYTTLWSSLFQQVIQFVLGDKQLSITTWDNKDVAVIKSKGYTLGKVFKAPLVENSTVWGGRQIIIISKARSNALDQHELWDDYQAYGDSEEDWNDVWTLNVLAKPIQPGDILCLLQGATKPTLIRPYKGYFIIIAIAVSPIAIRPAKKNVNSWPDILQTIVDFPRDFLLIWDWKEASSSLENNNEVSLSDHQALKYGEIDLGDILDGRELLMNTALILGDITIHDRAKILIKKVMEDYKKEFGDEHSYTLTAMHKLAWVYKRSNRLELCKHCGKWELSKEGEKLEEMSGILGRQGYYRPITTKKVVQLTRNYDEEVITLLLDRRGNEVTITEEVVKAAARNNHNNKEVLALLLDRRGDEITITEKIIDTVISNYRSRGDEVMKLLLDQRGDEITITEKSIRTLASNYKSHDNSHKVLKLLLDQQRDKLTITKGIVDADFRNSGKVTLLLLDEHGDRFTVAENVAPTIAKRFHSSVMALLLDRQEEKVTITEEIMKAAASNIYGGEMLKLLLNQRGADITITEKVIKAAARSSCGNEAIKVLFNFEKGNIIITEGILKAAAGNLEKGNEIMRLLLSRQRGKITITEKVAEAAAGNYEHGKAVMTLLLNQQRDQAIITEDAIHIVAKRFDKEVVLLLFEQGRNNMVWKDDTISIILQNFDVEVLELVLHQQNNITITSQMIKAAAGNYHSEEVMKQLLDQQGDKITITDEIMRVAAENEKIGIAMLQLLLNQRGDEIIITEEVVKAMARNKGYSSVEAIKQLLDQRGEEIKITEGIMKAAAENKEHNINMLRLFLTRRGDEIILTEEVIQSLARNAYSGDMEIIKSLLNQRGDEITVTEGIMVAAAENKYYSAAILQLLFDRRGDEIVFTWRIIKAMMNSMSSSGGMAPILHRHKDEIPKIEDIFHRYRDKIPIIEDIIKSIAGHPYLHHSTKMMKLLLDERGDDITITEEVAQAAARTNVEMMMMLLRE